MNGHLIGKGHHPQVAALELCERNIDYGSYKDRKALAQVLKQIYTAPRAEAGAERVEAFVAGLWGQRSPPIVSSWRRAWHRVLLFPVLLLDIRRVIYINPIECLNMQLREIIKIRGHLPTNEAVTKLIWIAICNVLVKLICPTYD